MFEELTKSIKTSLYDRTTSPLCGAFIISWSLWNYRLIFTLLSDLDVDKKFSYIDTYLYHHDIYVNISLLFIYPFCSSVLFLLLYPFPSKWIYEYWRMQQKNLKIIRQKIEDDTPITIEETHELRQTFSKRITSLNADILAKDHEVNFYMKKLEASDTKLQLLQKESDQKNSFTRVSNVVSPEQEPVLLSSNSNEALYGPEGEICFDYSTNNGLIFIGSDKLKFGICFSKASDTSIYVYRRDSSIEGIARVKKVVAGHNIDFNDFDSSSNVYKINVGERFLLKNAHGFYLQALVVSIKDDSRNDEVDEVCFKYKINLTGHSKFKAL